MMKFVNYLKPETYGNESNILHKRTASFPAPLLSAKSLTFSTYQFQIRFAVVGVYLFFCHACHHEHKSPIGLFFILHSSFCVILVLFFHFPFLFTASANLYNHVKRESKDACNQAVVYSRNRFFLCYHEKPKKCSKKIEFEKGTVNLPSLFAAQRIITNFSHL